VVGDAPQDERRGAMKCFETADELARRDGTLGRRLHSFEVREELAVPAEGGLKRSTSLAREADERVDEVSRLGPDAGIVRVLCSLTC
jgi:hypothetical protein